MVVVVVTDTFDMSLTPVLEVAPPAGTLRPGAAPRAYSSSDVLALLYLYFVIGVLYQVLPGLTVPVFATYFHVSSPSVVGGAFFMLATSKVVFGVLSDCFPLFGYRRKAWIIVGFAISTVLYVVLTCLNHGEPFVATRFNSTPTNKLRQDATVARGNFVNALCVAAAVACVLANVSADALMVEMAQREAHQVRGRLLSLVYAFRYFGTTTALLLGELLDSPAYGGAYSWDIGLNAYFAVLAVPCGLAIPLILVVVNESQRPSVNCPEYLVEFWDVITTRVMWQSMLFAFAFNFCSVLVSVCEHPVVPTWAGVDDNVLKWANVAGGVLTPLGFIATGLYGTEWNWRVAVVSSMALFTCLRTISALCITFNFARHPGFYITFVQAGRLPAAVTFIVTTYNFIEVTPPAKEGVTYGMLTSLTNVCYGIVPILATPLLDNLAPHDGALADTATTRTGVALIYGIGVIAATLACFCVLLLPYHKAHVKFLKVYGGRQPIIAALTLALCGASVAAAITVTVISILPSSVVSA